MSKARLAADWFTKLQQNAVTNEVEHTDVVAAETEIDTKAPLVHTHSNSGIVTVSGSASTYYPVLFHRGWGGKILINKTVHNYAQWDGHLTFQVESNPYGWGTYGNQFYVKQYLYSTRHFIQSVGSSPSSGSYIYVYLLGGGRTYSWITNSMTSAGGLSSGPFYTSTAVSSNGTWGPTTAAPTIPAKALS